MDGLHKLIEMLEKRFGKRAADGLLLLSVLGAAAWGLNTFAVDFVLPVAHAAASVWTALASMKPIALPSSAETVSQIGVALLAAAVAALVIRHTLRSRARLEKSLKAVRERLAYLEFDKRTAQQERDVLEYFIRKSGGSGLQLPISDPPDASIPLRPETREGR